MDSLNKTYRLVWNDSTGTWNVAHELARGRGKGSKSVRLAPIVAACVALLACDRGLADVILRNSSVDSGSVANQPGLTPNVVIGDSLHHPRHPFWPKRCSDHREWGQRKRGRRQLRHHRPSAQRPAGKGLAWVL